MKKKRRMAGWCIAEGKKAWMKNSQIYKTIRRSGGEFEFGGEQGERGDERTRHAIMFEVSKDVITLTK